MKKLLFLSIALLVLTIPFTSPNVSADEDLVIYTDYYQYDNNESLVYHIVGTNNTTYTVIVLHRDSDAPLIMTYKRTGVNETMVSGRIPLYGLTSFGVMELRAFNKSYNQSAKCEFRLVASQAWWTGETDRLIEDADARYSLSLYLIFAIGMVPIFIMATLVIKYRDKVKAASGELTISERMGLEDLWNYDDYANDVCARNPHSPSERAHLKYKTARWLFFDVVKAKKKIGVYRQLEEKEKELRAKIPKLMNDVLDAMINDGILTEKERKDMSAEDRFRLLNPGEKKVQL